MENEKQPWELPIEGLTGLEPTTDTDQSVLPDDVKWFQYQDKVNEAVSAQEKKEEEEAKIEQIKLGILKIVNGNQLIVNEDKNSKPMAPLNRLGLTDYLRDLNRINTKPKKIGPNDVCHCGSGRKYKKCCGRMVCGK